MTTATNLRSNGRRPRTGRARDEAGSGLVELAVVLALMTVLLLMTTPILDTLLSTTGYLNKTYTNTDQLIPVSSNLQELIRSAVQPAALTGGGVPTPPFGQYTFTTTGSTTVGVVTANTLTPYTLYWYSNVGSVNGPALMEACFVASRGSTTCVANPTSYFVVTETQANAGTCPTPANPTPSSGGCIWPATPSKLVLQVNGVTNGTAYPVFSYQTVTTTTTVQLNVSNTTTYATTTYTATSTPPISSVTNPSAGAFYNCNPNLPANNPATNTVTLSPLANCPAAEIDEVDVDLQVNAGSGSSARKAEDNSSVFLLSPVSSAFNLSVG